VRFLTNQGGLGDWGAYVADELGYFEEENIDFELSTFQNAADITAAMIAGQGDIATTSLPPVISGALQDAPLKLISATQMATPEGGFNNWWATLPDSGINSPADLRGKKVSIFNQNSLAQAVTRDVLAANGLEVGSYEEVAVPFPQAYTALEGGLVDASLFIEPFFTNSNAASTTSRG
jgi:NitT/TauT family transport system substrate-binding protein